MAPTRKARFASMVRILVNPFLEARRFQAYVIESSPGPPAVRRAPLFGAGQQYRHDVPVSLKT
jgi:hypothetical protein